jgi:two-component system sensor histidine kinase/response regulator
MIFMRWSRLIAIVVLMEFASLAAAFEPVQPTATQALVNKHVLVLISTGYGYRGIETYMTELVKNLQQGGVLLNNIHVEFLQMENQSSAQERQRLAAFLTQKYEKFNIELVYCVQQPALNFLLTDLPEFAPGAPVLNVNADLPADTAAGHRKFVFQARKLDVQGTVQSALALFPRTRQLIVLFGNGAFDLLRQKAIQADLVPWQGKLKIETTQALSADQIEARLATAPEHTIILSVGITQDAKGQKIVPDDFTRRIAQSAKAPVFTLYDSHMGFGALGGMVISIQDEAAKLADVGINILRGTTQLNGQVTNMPLTYVPMFDWQQLERWRADKNALPASAVFVNRPATLWGQYKGEVIAAAIALLLLSGLSAWLLVLNRRLTRVKDDLMESEMRFRVLVEQAPEAIIVYDVDLQRIVDANVKAEKLFDCNRETLLQGSPSRFYAPKQPDEMDTTQSIADHSLRALTGEKVNFARIVRRGDGKERLCDVWVVPLPYRHQRLVRASFIDVTERKRAELALQASLNEKVALLNEVHHRVNNNLQVITSLLRLETARSAQADTKVVLKEMQGRIRSMALLHESLYRSGVFASIELGKYVKQLATQAFRALTDQDGRIRLQLDLASVTVNMDQATPCGLLVNELVSNCLKHGFPDGRSGEVRIKLQSQPATQAGSAHVRLRVSDTGVGLGPDFETKRKNSLGLQLVSDLTRQLGGTLEIGPNAAFSVTFKAESLPAHAFPGR